MDTNAFIDLYAHMLSAVLPCTFLFASLNLVVNLFLNAFMNGKFKFGGKV